LGRTNRAALNRRGGIDVANALKLAILLPHKLVWDDPRRRLLHLLQDGIILPLVAHPLLNLVRRVEEAHARIPHTLQLAGVLVVIKLGALRRKIGNRDTVRGFRLRRPPPVILDAGLVLWSAGN
jgi:hypothetical protein